MTNTLSKIGLVVIGAIIAVASYGLLATTQVDAKGRPGAGLNIIELAEANGFTSLKAALDCTGQTSLFEGNRQFTVFAPTNEAFANALDALDISFAELCNDKATLANILAYHVTPGVKTSQTVLNRSSMNMLNRQQAVISGATIDGASIIGVDNRATIGVVHVIDTVMLP